MASTVNASKLTVVVREEIKLNNQNYGNKNSVIIGGVNDVSQRIVTVPVADTTTLLNLSGSVGAGTYDITSLKYARVTNLDNKNFVRLSFISSSAAPADFNRYDVRLDAGQSYIFTNSKISGSGEGDSFGSYVNFTSLKAKANTASIDLELFIATS